jgi:hypothetical protein
MKELQERFPDYTLHPLETTHHTNVLRLVKDGYPTLIAKTIWHDMSDPEGNMGIKAQDKAYRTEVKILKLLPKWWGIHLIDNFKTLLNRVIVTNEIINVLTDSFTQSEDVIKASLPAAILAPMSEHFIQVLPTEVFVPSSKAGIGNFKLGKELILSEQQNQINVDKVVINQNKIPTFTLTMKF